MRFRSKSEAFFFYLCMAFIAMLVMSQPVRAETILVTVTNLPEHAGFWSVPNSSYAGCTQRFYDNVQDACDATRCAYGGGFSKWVATSDAVYGYCVDKQGTPGVNYPGWSVALFRDTRCFANGKTMAEGAAAGGCIRYSCPPNQGWTLDGEFAGATCSRPDCAAGEVRNAATGVCEAVVNCPTLNAVGESEYLGYKVMSIPAGQDPNSPFHDACDSYNCAVNVNLVGHIFGVALVRTVPAEYECPGGYVPTTPTVLQVTLKERTAPALVDFDKVVEEAAKVSAPVIETEKEVLDRLKAQLDAVNDAIAQQSASLETAVTEQSVSAKNLSDAANRYMLNPTPENLEAFNQAKIDYAAKSAAARYKLTVLDAKKKEATGISQTVPLLEGEAQKQLGWGGGLVQAIDSGTAAGIPFDPAKVETHKGDLTGLQERLAAADAANQRLKDALGILGGQLGDLISKMNDLGRAVQASIDGMAGAGVADDGTVDTAPEKPPTEDFCTVHPNDPSCAPPSTVDPVAGGALPTLSGSWYEKKYPAGLGGVMSKNFNTMKNTPLFTVIADIVPTITGAAHTGCFTIEIWRVGTQQLCIPQIVMQALGVFMLLTAVFAARAIIFGG